MAGSWSLAAYPRSYRSVTPSEKLPAISPHSVRMSTRRDRRLGDFPQMIVKRQEESSRVTLCDALTVAGAPTRRRIVHCPSAEPAQVFENWPFPCKNTMGNGLRNRIASLIRWPTASRPTALSRGPESRRPSHRDGIRRSSPCPDRIAAKPASPHHSDRRSWRS